MKNLPSSKIAAENASVKVGEPAPEFTLVNHLGDEWKLGNQRGKVLALLFYPQNETLVCTRQLCAVRDQWSDYLETKADVIGISPNKVEKHLEFSKKYKLPLPILADESGAVTEIYCRHKIFPVNFMRSVVIIDADGIVRSAKTMLRVFRPTDRSVIAAIYSARADEFSKNYHSIAERFRSLKEYRV